MARNAKLISIAVILTLAIGIGINTGVFTLINGLVLRPRTDSDPATLWLANCCFAHIPLGFPFLLRFCDEQPGHSFYPFYCYPGPLARSWRRPFHSCGVSSPQAPTLDSGSLTATIAEFMHVGPRPRRLNGTLGTSHSSAPFRNRSEAFDTAWPSQSFEQAKVPRAVLPESPIEARPERTARRTHPCGRRNEAAQSQLGLSANRTTDRL